MSEAKKCAQCGGVLSAGTLEGLCPACLLSPAALTETRAGFRSFEALPVVAVARLFPQLEVIELLGKGGMGAVYKARQPALDRWVALKILPAQATGPGFGDRFAREARALARLNHPNIVTVYEFGQVEGLPYFMMEYVDGLTLRRLEKSGKLSAREVLQIIPQICEALQLAHDEGVVHRDIKPENILIDKKGRVKIADFGIAKIFAEESSEPRLTETRHAVGTPHYMAPEQVERPQAVDHRADIFSLGVVFYEMLTGELPLGRFAPPSRKVEVDIRLDEVVLRALEKEPERRYQRASEVKSEVQTIATAPKTAQPATASEARNDLRWKWWVGVGVLLLGLTFGAPQLAKMTKNPPKPATVDAGKTEIETEPEEPEWSVETVAPVVVQTEPVSGATNVPPGERQIRVTFSKEMSDGSWSWSTAWLNSTPEIVEGPWYEADRRTCVLKAKLEPGKTYGWWLNSGKFLNFQDTQNIPSIPYLLIFQTAAQEKLH